MKIPFVLECLVICVLVAFVSSKSVDRRYGRGQPLIETTTAKLYTNVTTSVKPAENSVRQEPIVSQEVQVVQDLVDSQESTPVIEQVDQSDPLQTNDVVKPVESNEISKPSTEKPLNENDPNPINKFCSCSSASCKCCRDFSIPLVPLRGPGCATVRYLENDKLSIGIKYGDFVLASRVVDSRRPTPICLPLPGGYNRFCGRVYGISRQDENFKACLGLELRADDDIEASLRVSCFQFGPKGLATMEAEPLPSTIEEDDDDDDDDDDDPLGLDELAGGEDDDSEDEEEDDSDSDEAPGPGGFVGDVLGGLLGGGGGGGGGDDDDDFGFTRFFNSAGDFVTDFFGGDSSAKNKKKPNEGISIDEKSKKKIDIAKKTPKTAANKKKDESDENESLLETIEDELAEELNDEEEQSTSPAQDGELKEVEKEEKNTEKDEEDDEDYKDKEDDDDDDEYKEDKEEDTEIKETKPSKKKKVTSSYGFGFLGRFFNFFA